MKKLIFVLTIAFFGTITAQTEKGSVIISGQTNLGFISNSVKYKSSGQTYDGPKTNTFNISPSVGYFVADNFAIGLAIDYKSTTTKLSNNINPFDPNDPTYSNVTKETVNTITFIPNASYYFSQGKTRPYLSAGIGLANTSYKYNNNTTKSNGLAWSANGGLLVIIAQNVALDFGLGYANYSYKNSGTTTSSGAFGAVVGISVFLK